METSRHRKGGTWDHTHYHGPGLARGKHWVGWNVEAVQLVKILHSWVIRIRG